jgi:hypothetical protein
MYVALGATEPFHTAELNGVAYRVANDGFRSVFSGALVGWQVRDSQLSGFGHHDPNIERERTETVRMTPYVESTGPRDPGNGYRWVDMRRQVGRGIIIIPPVGWAPSDDIMRATKGELVAIATEDFTQVRQHAAGDEPGFVLVEPAEGWQTTGKSAAPAGTEPSSSSLLIAAGIAIGVATVAYIVWGPQ